jgi:hypothetical protein
MPKDYRERRIDEKPPRWLTRHAKRDTTEVAVPGDVTPDPFPEPEPELIFVISTFSGGGAAGTVTTHDLDGPLVAGDIYLVAYAYSNLGSPGSISIAPRDVSYIGPSASTNYCGVRTWKIRNDQAGATSITVTVNTNPQVYYGWHLRGVSTSSALPAIVSTYDVGLVTYTAPSFPDPDPCLNSVGRTDVYGPATIVAPAAGSFGVYAASTKKGLCTSGAVMPILTGGASVWSGLLDGEVGFNFGTVSGGSGTMIVDADISEHGVRAGLTMFAVAPVEV